MRTETIDILGRPLRAYVPDGLSRSYYAQNRPAVVIFPGGGYEFTFEGEAEPIALRFAAEGIAAFVLDYSCASPAGGAFPAAIRQAFAAIRYVRARADEYGVNPGNIASCGFSAGGHLCACTGTLWNKPEAAEFFAPEEAVRSRPDKLLLCYPVIRGEKPCHRGSFEKLFGTSTLSQEQLRAYSLQTRVDAHTPPAFLWATAEDAAVPVCGALEFAQALSNSGVPFELHIWPRGDHGLCLGNAVTQPVPYGQASPVEAWAGMAVRFLYQE